MKKSPLRAPGYEALSKMEVSLVAAHAITALDKSEAANGELVISLKMLWEKYNELRGFACEACLDIQNNSQRRLQKALGTHDTKPAYAVFKMLDKRGLI